MRIDIITLFPELFEGPFHHSIIKRAKEKTLAEINLIQLREFGLGKFNQVDDYAFGGGAGMVLMAEPLINCIESLIAKNGKYDEVIYLSPDGETLSQGISNTLSLKKSILLICGHYKGIDQRIRDQYVTKEISIGDYVLSGGELAAAVLTDSIIRLLPDVLGDESSALTDSFQDGLLECPIYTRPAEINGWKVPDVLLSGNFKEIEKWRHDQSLLKTKKRRPDLLD